VTGSNHELSEILTGARTIAVVGIKDRESEDAYRVPRYLQERGFRVLPVNPKFETVLGEPCVAGLADLQDPVDIVNLFRAIDHIPAHVEEIVAMSPRPTAVWMQLGILHGAAATQLRAANIHVIQDRCIMVEHKRLLGS
jgi:predicted CoA-binding protein